MNRIGNSEPTSIFAFTGRPHDKEVGLQANLHRQFDPTVGQWVNKEPIGYQGGNTDLYRYVGNRPE